MTEGESAAAFRLIRDVVLLIAGLCLLGYETFIVVEPRLVIIGVAVAMLGLPGTLVTDRILSARHPSGSSGDTP